MKNNCKPSKFESVVYAAFKVISDKNDQIVDFLNYRPHVTIATVTFLLQLFLLHAKHGQFVIRSIRLHSLVTAKENAIREVV